MLIGKCIVSHNFIDLNGIRIEFYDCMELLTSMLYRCLDKKMHVNRKTHSLPSIILLDLNGTELSYVTHGIVNINAVPLFA